MAMIFALVTRPSLSTLLAVLISGPALADHIVGVPTAEGLGLEAASLFPAPAPASSPPVPIWFAGALTFGAHDLIEVSFAVAPSADTQVVTLLLGLQNNSGVVFDSLALELDGAAMLATTQGAPPPSLLPMGGPPTILSPTEVMFDTPISPWPGNGDANTLSISLEVDQSVQDQGIILRLTPLPEPGTGMLLVAAGLLARRRR